MTVAPESSASNSTILRINNGNCRGSVLPSNTAHSIPSSNSTPESGSWSDLPWTRASIARKLKYYWKPGLKTCRRFPPTCSGASFHAITSVNGNSNANAPV